MLQRRNIDWRKLVVTKSKSLSCVALKKSLGTTLHLDRRTTELPNRESMQDRRLACIVPSPQEGHAWVEVKSNFSELLETMERDPGDHHSTLVGTSAVPARDKSASLGQPAEWEDEGEAGDPTEAVADLG
jgi:hypothetical protein